MVKFLLQVRRDTFTLQIYVCSRKIKIKILLSLVFHQYQILTRKWNETTTWILKAREICMHINNIHIYTMIVIILFFLLLMIHICIYVRRALACKPSTNKCKNKITYVCMRIYVKKLYISLIYVHITINTHLDIYVHISLVRHHYA